MPRRLFVHGTNSRVDHPLQAHLTDLAEVSSISRMSEVRDAEGDDGRWLRLMDCEEPTMPLSSADDLRARLPSGAAIVLWGFCVSAWRELETTTAASYLWVHCSKEVTGDDLAPLCRTLLT